MRDDFKREQFCKIVYAALKAVEHPQMSKVCLTFEAVFFDESTLAIGVMLKGACYPFIDIVGRFSRNYQELACVINVHVVDLLDTLMHKNIYPMGWNAYDLYLNQEMRPKLMLTDTANSSTGLYQLTRKSEHLHPYGNLSLFDGKDLSKAYMKALCLEPYISFILPLYLHGHMGYEKDYWKFYRGAELNDKGGVVGREDGYAASLTTLFLKFKA